MATYLNKNGTDNSDFLSFDSSASSTVVYHAGRGNDTIAIAGGKVTVYTDAGNNTITVSGGAGHVIQVKETVAEGDKINGKDILLINYANQVDAILGSGSDDVIICNSNGKKNNGNLSQIRAGLWGDTFVTYDSTENYQLYGDAGNDVFTIRGGSNLVCWGGAANDTFNVSGGTGIKLRGGDSADVYNITDKATAVDMQLGYGNDVVTVAAGNKHTIKGNLGINEINLLAGTDHVITADIDQAASKKMGYSDADIKAGKGLGYGVDKVFVNGAQKVKANLGDGRDYVELANTEGSTIYTEGWGDTVVVNSGAVKCTVETGLGDDELIANGGEGNYCWTGQGNDTLYLNGGTQAYFNAGSGDDLIIVDGLTGNKNQRNSVWMEEGNDTLIVKEADYLNVYGGEGAKKVKVAGGDQLRIQASGADDLVYVTGGQYAEVTTYGGSDRIYFANSNKEESMDMVLRLDDNTSERDYIWIDWGTMPTGLVRILDTTSGNRQVETEKQDKIMIASWGGIPNLQAKYDAQNDILSLRNSSSTLDLYFFGREFVSEIYLQDHRGFLNNTCKVLKVKDIIDNYTEQYESIVNCLSSENVLVQDDPFKFKSVNDAFNIFSAYE